MIKPRLIRGIPLFFIVLSLFVNPAFAPVDLTQFDDNLGSALGVGSFGGGLLLTMIIFVICIGCVGAASKRKPSDMIIAIFAVGVMSFGVVATWFPLYFLTFLIVIIAFLFGHRIIKGLR